MKITGIVKKGLGQGKYFMSLNGYKKGFYKILKYYPFKGTLNIELNKKDVKKIQKALKVKKIYTIEGFKENNKEYKKITFIKIKIFNNPAIIVFPFYRHNPKNVIEIASKYNLRKKYKLKDNDKVEIEIN